MVEELETRRTKGDLRVRAAALGVFGFLFLLSLRAWPQDKTVSLAFVGPGRLAIAGSTGGRGFVIDRLDASGSLRTTQTLGPQLAARRANEFIKKDRNGDLYLVWEEPGVGGSRVGFGRAEAKGTIASEPLRLPSGWNSLPDLVFDASNGAWLAWVNADSGSHSLLVRQTAGGRTLRLASARAFLRPRLASDGQGRVWVFWGETSPDSFRILFRVRAGGTWTPAVVAWDAGPLAIESFDAAVDDAGTAWIAWSQFGGRGYEVRVKQMKPGPVGQAVPVSTDPDAQNIGPSIALAKGWGPVVSWVRLRGKQSSFCLRLSSGGSWSREKVVAGVDVTEALPRLAVEGGAVGIVWSSGGKPAGRVIPLARLASQGPPAARPRPLSGFFDLWELLGRLFPSLILNPDLDESSYIGYGDSITYGVINSENHPDLGYVPRLEALLDENFGPSKVINEGVGSQITANGLAHLGEVLAADLARYILLLEGTNDTVTLIYNPDVTDFNLRQMAVQSRGFGSFPALATLLPRFDAAARPDRILEVNERIRESTALLAVPLVDFYALFTDYPIADGGVMSLISGDGLHPNEKGYQFMAEKWFEAIRDFPFPPQSVRVSREYDRIFFFEKPGNMLSWEDNNKVFDKTRIQGYRVYRKPRTAGDGSYALIATPEGTRQYFDTNIDPGLSYTYVIATVMAGGMEGPASVAVTL